MINDDNDYELEERFNKHIEKNNRPKLVFDNQTVKDNKKLIKEFTNLNLLQETHHFSLDDMDQDTELESADQNYFGDIIESTLKNESLYCSYLDQFDKMGVDNLKSNSLVILGKTSLSCAACFSEICLNGSPVKGLSDVSLTNQMVNCFQDYFEVYTVEQVKGIISEKMNKISEEVEGHLGLGDDEMKYRKEFSTMKCSNCYTLVGFFDCETVRYIVINAI
jgi:hypothetical protein